MAKRWRVAKQFPHHARSIPAGAVGTLEYELFVRITGYRQGGAFFYLRHCIFEMCNVPLLLRTHHDRLRGDWILD